MTKKFRVTKEVSMFRVGDKRYMPGDIAEVPDNFPAHLYSFLRPVGEKAAPQVPQPTEAQIGTPVTLPVGQPLKKRRWP